jgi:hypothetical protein
MNIMLPAQRNCVGGFDFFSENMNLWFFIKGTICNGIFRVNRQALQRASISHPGQSHLIVLLTPPNIGPFYPIFGGVCCG